MARERMVLKETGGSLDVSSDAGRLSRALAQAGCSVPMSRVTEALWVAERLSDQLYDRIPALQRQAGFLSMPGSAAQWQVLMQLAAAGMLINHLTGKRRDWLSALPGMGAALEIWQLLTGSANRARQQRYPLTLDGWTRFEQEFGRDTEQQILPGPWISPELMGARAPLDTLVTQAVHQPLPGEVALLVMDGDIDELKERMGRTLAWWSRQDSGVLIPVWVADNGQQLVDSDELLLTDTRPVNIACALLEAEAEWPLRQTADIHWLPWLTLVCQPVIAVAIEPAASTGWPAKAAVLRQPRQPLRPFMVTVNRPDPHWQGAQQPHDVLSVLDRYFADICEINPALRPRLASHLGAVQKTLPISCERLGLRSAGTAGALLHHHDGELLVNACLGNQMGINMLVTHESAGLAILEPVLQAIAFARRQKLDDEAAPWAGLPLVCRHDPAAPEMTELLLSQSADQMRVLLIPDGNTAQAALKSCYGETGVVMQLVIPDGPVASIMTPAMAEQLVSHGAVCLHGHCAAEIQLVASGYQSLQQALQISERLQQHQRPHSLVYLLEPGRFRHARDSAEAGCQVDDQIISGLFPEIVRQRLVFCDMRPEVFIGHCRRLHLDSSQVLGFSNHPAARLGEIPQANACSWLHGLVRLALSLGLPEASWLTESEWQSLQR
ncbi:hypothetical protein [Oceanobacter sp. 3_MG-2023]|uniref:hypothetical protein n=2 Tax=Gammaproteobacteria TaxID=1236 RepID=UPI00273458FF|nr:hypothetical protein [Oceanobacter sp. 3_MG-2023]MDP2505070.1 hypothetical protein [Oceanobacter sp. 3_MG-2023]